jgi:hypothetical protein
MLAISVVVKILSNDVKPDRLLLKFAVRPDVAVDADIRDFSSERDAAG